MAPKLPDNLPPLEVDYPSLETLKSDIRNIYDEIRQNPQLDLAYFQAKYPAIHADRPTLLKLAVTSPHSDLVLQMIEMMSSQAQPLEKREQEVGQVLFDRIIKPAMKSEGDTESTTA